MSAELLRRAAKEMRERAEAALSACGDQAWQLDLGVDGYDVVTTDGFPIVDNGSEEVARHVASWQPVAALAAAELLDSIADFRDHLLVDEGVFTPPEPDLVAVLARAFLREPSL